MKSIISIIVLSNILAVLMVIMLDHREYFTREIYDCSSSKFNEFPREIQQECIRALEEELKDLIRRQLEESTKKSYIEV
jgi:hypothetical protein